MPKTQVRENSGDIFDSFSLEALAIFETQKNPQHLLKHLMHLRQVKFILAKADVQEKKFPFWILTEISLQLQHLISQKNSMENMLQRWIYLLHICF